ncbi:hypothetical protein [Jannaschia sp. R86511]|uniref:hypothetical protein n=1 Tax=Jannaschia sp. R86511 TaxID=3093853 RepID=UPI0036D40A3A
MSPLGGGTESALGRYLPPLDPAGDEPVQVRLEGLPPALLLAAREQHDGLLRELRLLWLEDDAGEAHPSARLSELVAALVVQGTPPRSRRDEEIEAALARGQERIDLVERVPVAAGEVAERLGELLADGDRLCEQGQLMTLPRSPLLRRFTTWYLEQYRDQVQGRPPVRWDGPTRISPSSD